MDFLRVIVLIILIEIDFGCVDLAGKPVRIIHSTVFLFEMRIYYRTQHIL